MVQLNLAESWLQPTDTARLVGVQGTRDKKGSDEAAHNNRAKSTPLAGVEKYHQICQIMSKMRKVLGEVKVLNNVYIIKFYS